MRALGTAWNVLVAPREAFSALAPRPKCIGVLLLVAAVMAIGDVIAWTRVDISAGLVDDLGVASGGDLGRSGRVSDEQLATMASITRSFAIGAAFVMPTMNIAFAAVGLVVLLRLSGLELSIARALSVCVHASVPMALRSCIVAIVALSRSSITVREVEDGTLVASSLAVLAPADASRPTVTLLASFDAFALWSVVLAALGVSLQVRGTRARATIVVFVGWGALAFLRVAGETWMHR